MKPSTDTTNAAVDTAQTAGTNNNMLIVAIIVGVIVVVIAIIVAITLINRNKKD